MDARRFWIGFALLALLSLLPIAVTEIPPYADYPNHLARARVLAHYNENPFFQEFWRPAWAVLPNILTDLLLVGAAKILPITVAGRVVLGLIIVTIGAGFAFARREVVGKYDALGFGGLLLAYGFPIQMGFLNFALGVGLLFVLFGLHLRLRERGSALYLAVMVPASVLLFLCHLMAFALLVLVLGAWEVAQSDRSHWKASLLRIAGISILPAILFKLSPTNGQVNTWGASSAMLKLKAIPLSFASGDSSTDFAFLAMIVLLAGTLLLGKAKWSRPAATVLIVVAVLFIIAPFGLGSTRNLDNRIPYVLALFALAMIVPGREERKGAHLGLIVGTLLLHTAGLTTVAMQRGRLLDTLRAQLRELPTGSLLFSAVDEAEPVWKFSAWNPPLPSAHTMALVDGEVFPSGLFMIPGQQPLLIRPGLEAIYWARSGVALDPSELRQELQANLAPLPEELRRRPRFLMLCGPEAPRVGPALVAQGPRYAIYRL